MVKRAKSAKKPKRAAKPKVKRAAKKKYESYFLILPDNESVRARVSAKEKEEIARQMKKFGGSIDMRANEVRFKGGGMAKMSFAALVNQKLDSQKKFSSLTLESAF